MTPLEMALALCELEDDELNEEQAEFVDRLTRRLEAGQQVTEKQVILLTKLYKKWCR